MSLQKFPHYLLIDTACARAVVGLASPSRILAERYLVDPRNHDRALPLLVDEVLAETQIEMSELSGIIVGIGPGSFIGVRLGLAHAKGMALALQIPLAGVSTLLAIGAGSSFSEGKAYVAIDARKGQYYVQPYEKKGDSIQASQPPFAVDKGGAYELNENQGPTAGGLLRVFLSQKPGFSDAWKDLLPAYCREPDVYINKPS